MHVKPLIEAYMFILTMCLDFLLNVKQLKRPFNHCTFIISRVKPNAFVLIFHNSLYEVCSSTALVAVKIQGGHHSWHLNGVLCDQRIVEAQCSFMGTNPGPTELVWKSACSTWKMLQNDLFVSSTLKSIIQNKQNRTILNFKRKYVHF